jgi:hypothetical protein
MAQVSRNAKYDENDVRAYMGRRMAQLMSERTDHEPNWKEIQQFILPRAGAFADEHGNENRIPNYDEILNSTATNAVKVFTAFIMAGMSSPARPWFKLVVGRVGRDSTPEEAHWLDKFRDVMLEVFARSNFYHILPRVYEEGGSFGNGCMYISEDIQDVVRFYHYTVGEFYWGLSDRLEIDTIYRPFTMKVAQVVSRWGVNNVSDKVRQQYETQKLDELVHVVHAIEPNVRSLPKSLRPFDKTKKYISVYYEQTNNGKMNDVLNVSGFREFPAMPFRLHPRSDDAYGIGVGTECLGDVRELQHKEFELAKILDYVADPHLKSTAGVGQIFRHPGAVSQVNPHHNDVLEPVFQANYPDRSIREDISVLEQRIREWFDNHLAQQILNNDRSNVTAREIEAAEQEKLLLAGPVLESVQVFLKKVIDRTFEVMLTRQIGPPPPESLQGIDLDVEFLGVLAQAQKAVGIRAIERGWEFGAYLSQALLAAGDPQAAVEVFDNYNTDESIRDFVRMVGMPTDQTIGADAVGKVRADRAQASQQAEQMAQAQAMAETGKTLAETPTGGETALRSALDVVGAPF